MKIALIGNGAIAKLVTAFCAERADRFQIVGAIGVIGPARLNYARVIPLVDYTARVLGQVMNA